jgi:hypothetical protein
MVNDNKTRCRCTSSCDGPVCECSKGGRPVPVPARLPGRLGDLPVSALTAAGRSGSAAQRRAAQAQVMGSAPERVRRAHGYTGPVSPRALSLTEQVGPAWRATFAAGGWRPARRLGEAMLEARKRGLPGDGFTEALVAAYTSLWGAGDPLAAERVHETLAGRVERLCREDDRRRMDALAARVHGSTAVLVASAARRRVARMDRLAVERHGPEKAAAMKEMGRLRRRVDAARQPGRGSAS